MKNSLKRPLSNKRIWMSFLRIFLFFLAFSAKSQPTTWQTTGLGGGGALYSPSFNPANPNEIYIGCDMTPLFHTTNQGTTWKEKPFQQIQGGVFSEVQFTRSPTIRYCVNHAAKDYVDRLRPFKTDDDGATWYPLIAPIQEYAGVLRLFADYNSPSRVVLADYNQVFFSVNGGGDFTKIYNTPLTTSSNHIAGVCFDGTKIYICCEDGIYYSTDNGANWAWMTMTGIAAGEKILSFTYAKTGDALKFVCLTASRVWAGIRPGSTYWGSMRGIFTMMNADGQWKSHREGISDVAGDFVISLGMAQNDTSTIYAAGGDGYLMPIVMKSVNSQAWSHRFFQFGNQNVATGWGGHRGDRHWDYGSAPQGFQVCPSNSNILMTTDLGFTHISTDGGTTWQQRYLSPADQNTINMDTPKKKNYHSNGLENTASWSLTWLDATKIMASSNDIGGITSNDGGGSWHFTPILETTTYGILKYASGKVYAATSTVHDLYESTRIYDTYIDNGGGKLYFSADNGVTFSVLKDFGHPIVWIASDPTDPSVMYASVPHSDTNIGGIYKTSDIQNGTGATWTKLSHPSGANGHPFNIRVLNNGDLVTTFSARAPTVNSKFEATSGVFYYDKNTQTWSNRSHTFMRFWTKDITIDPSDPTQSTWYVSVFQGWGDVAMQGTGTGTGGLYRTRDKGLTWARINREFRVSSATVHPLNPNLLYFTTETNGLWYSSNATANAPTFSLVESYTFRNPLRVFFNPHDQKEIWITSFGNGIKVGYDPSIVILPLDLVDFSGYTEGGKNILKWQTENEINVSHFDIERSENGQVFEKIGQTKSNSKGGSYPPITQSPNHYQFVDATIGSSDSRKRFYYRLKINDLDATFTCSKIISIAHKTKNKVNIFPSVTRGNLTLENVKSLDIYNSSGLIVKTFERIESFQTLDMSNFPNGIYFIKGVDTEGFGFSEKVIKQ